MFSVGNLYLPYYKWTSNYQLKAQAGFFIQFTATHCNCVHNILAHSLTQAPPSLRGLGTRRSYSHKYMHNFMRA